LVASFGDDTTAVLVYDQHRPGRRRSRAECLTVANGKITHMRIIFDRLPFDTARRAVTQS
jgi:hypothetical protein